MVTRRRPRWVSVILLSLCFSLYVQAQEQPNNQSADNFGTNNNNSTVSSYNETKATTNNYSGAGSSPGSMPVGSAIAPSLMSNGMDSCLMSTNGGVQSFGLGLSTGAYRQDENCNRRRDAKVLSDLNMKVASIALMCQDEFVWEAMFISGTPCPILVNSRLVAGRAAYLAIKQNPELYIPNYGKVKKKRTPSVICRRYTETKVIIDCNPEILWESSNQYNAKQKFYNTILTINGQSDEKTTTTTLSISERFRSSLKSSG
tara:strand:- start:8857 stop:9633 length:777 start_codon:yes stop_codon:yes gene_type:complete